MDKHALPSLTLAIVTLDREAVLQDAILQVLSYASLPDEILIVDQDGGGQYNEARSEAEALGVPFVVKATQFRSTTTARNYAISEASCDVVLFIDDDVDVATDITAAHKAVHADSEGCVAAGGHINGYPRNAAHAARQTFTPKGRFLSRIKGGNMSFKRKLLLDNGLAFNSLITCMFEESDFCSLLVQNKLTVANCSGATVIHLAHTSGGTRTGGKSTSLEHLSLQLLDQIVGRVRRIGRFASILWLFRHFRQVYRVWRLYGGGRGGMVAIGKLLRTGFCLGGLSREVVDHYALSNYLINNNDGLRSPKDVYDCKRIHATVRSF